MKNLISNSLKVCAFVLSILLAVQANAQQVGQSLLNCPNPSGTSGDLSVVNVFVDAPACASCTGGNATYPLKMTIHNGTKSERTAFALFGTLSSGASINGFSGNIVVCVGAITVKSSDDIGFGLGNQTFTVGNITFACSSDLQLTNNVLAWTDAAGTTIDRCNAFLAATSCKDVQPKCDTAASINIRQPLSFSKSQTTSCSNSATGSVTVTPIGGTSPYTIVIDGTTFSSVTTATKSPLAPGPYNFSVTDAANCTTSSTQTVNSQSCCTPPTVQNHPSSDSKCSGQSTSFSASSTGGSPTPTVQWQVKPPAGSFSNLSNAGVYSGVTTGTLNISDCIGLNGYQYQAVFTSTGCTPATSNPATLTVNALPVAPSVVYNAPLCYDSTFSLTIGSVGNPIISGGKYTVLDKNGNAISGISPASPHTATASEVTNNQIIFSNIPAGSGYVVNIESASGCVPSGAALPCQQPVAQNRNATSSPAIENFESQTTTVKAYPNPFSDRVIFQIKSSVSGKGSLDIYNMMGQKVKTVYSGFITTGLQIFELSLPTHQVSNLIYVLRIGDKKMTGKILQINQ